jgi:hypothetical protein
LDQLKRNCNGIDDDNNGYVDDIHGWNFLGDITKENLEYERIIKDKTLVDEVTYKEAKKINDDKVAQAKAGSSRLEQLLTLTGNADAVIEKHLKPVYTIDEVNAIDSKSSIVESKATMQRMLSYGMSVVDLEKAIQGDIDEMTALLNGDNLKQDYRKVVGDNQTISTQNTENNVMGPDKEKFFMERTLQELLHS